VRSVSDIEDAKTAGRIRAKFTPKVLADVSWACSGEAYTRSLRILGNLGPTPGPWQQGASPSLSMRRSCCTLMTGPAGCYHWELTCFWQVADMRHATPALGCVSRPLDWWKACSIPPWRTGSCVGVAHVPGKSTSNHPSIVSYDPRFWWPACPSTCSRRRLADARQFQSANIGSSTRFRRSSFDSLNIHQRQAQQTRTAAPGHGESHRSTRLT
jgi:hypothetical protein